MSTAIDFIMKNKILNIYNLLLPVVFAVLLCFFGVFGAVSSTVVYAADLVTASNVLDDLHKDESFDESYYPVISNDYSLQVIQIAESTDGELLIYVYQPSGQDKKLTASSINISRTINDDISYYNFKLTLLNSDGVFFKYLVNDLTVLSENIRYYVISSIFRSFDETIDNQASSGNVVTEVDFEVAKQYCFGKINGKEYSSVVDIETIEITDKFVGFVRYSDGHNWWGSSWPFCDSHFVAFNTDKQIDKLIEADVYYTYQSYYKGHNSNYKDVFGDKLDGYAYLKYDQKVEHTGDQFRAGTYTWKRIETVEEFIAENDIIQNVYSGAIIDINVANKITDEGKKALEGKQWLLRFTETEYEYSTSGSAASGNFQVNNSSTLVGDVTILRLKFETDGIIYNLGVIDNKQSNSGSSVNMESISYHLSTIAKSILGILLLLFLFLLLSSVKPVASVFAFIFKGIKFVITFPFRFLKSVFKRRE